MTEFLVECHALLVLWFFASLPFSFKQDENWLWTTLLQTLERTGNCEIGLLVLACSWSPSFGMGVTSAVFLIEGKVQVPSEVLMIEVIVGRIDGGPSLMTWTGILSFPGALLEDIDIIISSTCLHSVVQKVHCSDKGYCFRTKLSSSKSKLNS